MQYEILQGYLFHPQKHIPAKHIKHLTVKRV